MQFPYVFFITSTADRINNSKVFYICIYIYIFILYIYMYIGGDCDINSKIKILCMYIDIIYNIYIDV